MDLSNYSILSSSPSPNSGTFGFFTSETGSKFDKNSWKHIYKTLIIFCANGDLSTFKLKLKREGAGGAVVTCP
jgi:hypothetical protein